MDHQQNFSGGARARSTQYRSTTGGAPPKFVSTSSLMDPRGLQLDKSGTEMQQPEVSESIEGKLQGTEKPKMLNDRSTVTTHSETALSIN